MIFYKYSYVHFFTGKITNWQEIGGPNLKIKPFKIKRQQYADLVIDQNQQRIFKNPYGANVQEIARPTEVMNAVAKTPGSISYITFSEIKNQKNIKAQTRILPIAEQLGFPYVSPCEDEECKTYNKNVLTTYPKKLIGRIYVIAKDDKSEYHKKIGVAYANMLLSDEGQKLVKEAGFVPLRVLSDSN
ncbi:MAG: hypothetical protein KME60_18015 [Cyanomargarita calcarea GSE-NOS-MK-12-04C]|jgi:phosphate transport system substrate-binding protein|uniref:PBP domain-containing protein n=1 Tax=Cyanomargarita calcarea GSE-NOS-MK-12-04C TaxID=2839659 RepID=A0A951QMR3_9CYAN|nr:hypothetical protein [Cyanomargarita calcarea GSE-NOS-MK-12-04C]